jgi:carboxyl-terminal processing protease
MRHFLLGVGMCLLFFSAKAQNTSPENVRLASVCRAWGFLKYYHPATQSPAGFWDQQLVKAVRDSFAVRSDADASYVITKWIELLNSKQPMGKPLPERIWSQRESRNFNPPWNEQGNIFRDPLNTNLQNVLKCKRKSELYHVALEPNDMPAFLNELPYNDWQFPDEAGRILTVARMWNVLNYFYPYASQAFYPMNQLLEMGIEEVREANDMASYHLAIWNILANLNNPYVYLSSEVLEEKLGAKYLPLKCIYENGKLLVTGFYAAEDLESTEVRVGDIISEVDGLSVDSLLIQRFPNWHKMSPCDQYLLGFFALVGNHQAASLKVTRDGEISTKVMRRVDKLVTTKGSQNPVWRRESASVGIIHTDVLSVSNLKEVMDSAYKVQTLILDFRGDLSIEPQLLAKYFCSDKVNYALVSKPELASPGYFIDEEMQSWGKPNKNAYPGKLVLLVNETATPRAVELANMCSYLPNATVVGSCVLGSDNSKMSIPLPGNLQVMISGLGYYGAGNESKLHGGVGLDRQVIPSATDLSSGKDVVKAKAMEP